MDSRSPAMQRTLESWLERQSATAGRCKLGALRPAATGFSAETLFATLNSNDGAGRVIVIRLEQPGGEIFLDTDIGRQAQVMRALRSNGIPVPVVIGVEEDTRLIGRRFLVMECAPGRPFPQTPNYNHGGWVKELEPGQRAQLWRRVMTLIGRTNRLTTAAGFEFLNRPQYGRPGIEQYLGWLTAWRAAALRAEAHPIIDAALRHLHTHRPPEIPASFIWGDSNPCNILFNPDLTVSVLLDFEAAALGPAEVDLGWWFFLDRTRTAERPSLAGVPGRAECIETYEAALGRRTQNIGYFEILGGVRMALVIVRTVERLVAAGCLTERTDAAINNPMTAALAGLLRLPSVPVGQGFKEFVAAVTAHGHGH